MRWASFFLAKNSGELRLIVDCGQLNQMIRCPPKTHLATSAAFCGVAIPDGQGLLYASHDVDDCFYQVCIPAHLSKYLGLRPVRAVDVGVTDVDGMYFSPHTMIVPMLSVLPMGFSFALHWAQMAHENILVRSGAFGREQFLVDFKPPPDLSNQVGGLVYVDNGVFASCIPGFSGDAQGTAAAVLVEAGLPVHEITEEESSLVTLGLASELRQASVEAERRWRLIQVCCCLDKQTSPVR